MKILPVASIDALRRYAAMTESLDGLTGRALEQAIADREEYAAEYTADNYRAFAKPALLVRFLYEVCDISLYQARDCAKELLRFSRGYRLESLEPAADTALEVFVDNNNIFAALAAADLFHAAAKGTVWEKRWCEVLDILRQRKLI